jgi:hypothetical protein
MRVALGAAAALALVACGANPPEREWPIREQWAVSGNASEACLSAARRASKFCLDKTLNSDIYGVYTSECTKARWDHARSCN